MKRPSYKHAVEWIALNDNAGNGDTEEEIAGYISTALVADIFDISTERVASDVAKHRGLK